MSPDESLYGLTPEQYGIRKTKGADIQALDIRLFTTLSDRRESQQRVYLLILSLIMTWWSKILPLYH